MLKFYIIIYLFSVVTSNLTSLYFKGGSYIGGGASGAIFGLIGTLAALLITHRKSVPLGVLKPLSTNSNHSVSFLIVTQFFSKKKASFLHLLNIFVC